MRSVRLAHFSGVSTDSLRRYERLVLLARPPRTARGSPDLLVSGVWSRQRKASALWRAAGSGGWMKMFTAMLTSFSANVPYHFHITKPSSWAHWAETTLA